MFPNREMHEEFYFMKAVRARAGLIYDSDAVSLENGLECLDDSLTQQHQAEEADINTIVRRFGISGVLPQSIRLPQYGDFDAIIDYQTALDAVIAADKAFMEVPADIRARFDNQPQLFLEFCSDPSNLEELRKLGLAKPAAADSSGGPGAAPPARASAAAQ